MSTLPTSEEMSWLFSSPGSVLAMRDLAQPRGIDLHDPEPGDVAAELVEPLEAPGAHQPGEPAARDAVAVLEHGPHLLGVEQPQRALEDRADLIAGLQHVDRMDLHQRLEALGERRLAAADGAEQIEDLLALLQPLRGVAEEGDDALDRLLHAVELGEGRIDPDGPVHEDAAEPGVPRGVDEFRFADGGQDALRRARIHHRIVAAAFEIFAQRHLGLAARVVGSREAGEQVVGRKHGCPVWHCSLHLSSKRAKAA